MSSIFIFRIMSFNTPNNIPEISESQSWLDTLALSQVQRNAVQAILKAIDKNPESQESMKLALWDVFHTVTHSPEKLDWLLSSIELSKSTKLAEITEQYNKWKLSGPEATQDAQDAIHHHARLSLLSLKDSMQAQSA